MPPSAAAPPAPPAPRRSVGRAHAVPHCRGSPRWLPRSRCRCVQYRQSAATGLRTSAPCPVAPPSSRHTRNPPSLPAGRYTLYRPTVAPCLLFVRNFKIAGATVRPPAFPANRRRTIKKPGMAEPRPGLVSRIEEEEENETLRVKLPPWSWPVCEIFRSSEQVADNRSVRVDPRRPLIQSSSSRRVRP